MFSGKSEEMIRRLRRAEIAGQRVVIFKPCIDDRYDATDVVSHAGARMTVLLTGSTLRLDDVVRVARDGEDVEVAPEAVERMLERRAIVERASSEGTPAYGVTTGVGMIGTGPFRLKSQNKQRAELVRFNGYWGGKPPLDGVTITFYADPAPMVLALRAGQLDIVQQMSPQQARAFKNNTKYRVYTVPVSSHNMLGEICETTEPPLVEAEDGHYLRCHIPIEELRRLQGKERATA